MMNTRALVEVEKLKLAAKRMGVDFPKLLETSESCMDEALVNLKPTLDKESEVLRRIETDGEE